MPDEVLFAGGRLECFNVSSGSAVERTTSTQFDSAFADCSIYMAGASRVKAKLYTSSANVLTETVITSGRKVFVHWVCYNVLFGGGSPGTNMVEIIDSNNHPWVAIVCVDGADYNVIVNTNTGASPNWVQAGTGASISSGRETFDMEITIGSPHQINVYRNGNIWKTHSFTQALFTNIASVDFGNNSNNIDLSEVIITENIPTIGARLRTARATGAGNKNQWSATHTAVNEVIGSDANAQTAASAGLISTHAMKDVTIGAGFEIKSVFHWMRAKQDGAAPQNLKSVLRQGGVDYSTGNLNYVGVGYGPVGARYDFAPDGSAWSQSIWNAIEAGYESAT